MNKKTRITSVLYCFFKMIAIMIPVIAGLCIAYFFLYHIVFSITDTTAVSYEDGAISIIALAVAVWTGINLSNAIEKSSVDKIMEDLETTTEGLNSFKAISSDFNKTYANICRTEILTTLETSDDLFYKYLRRNYVESIYDDYTEKDSSIDVLKATVSLSNALKMVMYIRELHERDDLEGKAFLYQLSDDLLGQISNLKNGCLSDSFKNILEYLMGDLLFYKAFSRYDVGDDTKRYIEIAELFLDAERVYGRLRPVFVESNTPSIIKRYYDNAIAQCFSEILLCFDKCRDNETDLKSINKLVSKEFAIEEAQHYAELVFGRELECEYPNSNELFCKNRGLIYERIARIKDMTQDEYFQYMRQAIASYEDAYKYGRQEKTYYVLCSAYNTLIIKMISRGAEENCFLATSRKSIWDESFIIRTDREDYDNYLKRLQLVSQKAMTKWPEKSFYRCMYWQSELYRGVFSVESREGIIEKINSECGYLHEKGELSDREVVLRNVLQNIIKQRNKEIGIPT